MWCSWNNPEDVERAAALVAGVGPLECEAIAYRLMAPKFNGAGPGLARVVADCLRRVPPNDLQLITVLQLFKRAHTEREVLRSS